MGSPSNSTLDLIDTALITGGAGGIGKGLAEYLISKGKKVIIAGRTESKLQEAAKEIGATAYYVLDTGDVQSIPDFVKKLTHEHPEVNCLINNAGVQRPFQFPGSGGKDYEFDLSKADQEININIRGPMHLAISLLPYFTSSSQKKSVIVNVSSVLGFNPMSVINPVYNGTKAWVHMFTMNMRTQLAQGGGNVKVVEIVPPTVSTELHRERKDPHDNSKEKTGGSALSLEEFMKEVSKGFEEGKDTISAGPGKDVVKTWEDGVGKLYEKAVSGQ